MFEIILNQKHVRRNDDEILQKRLQKVGFWAFTDDLMHEIGLNRLQKICIELKLQ